MSFMTKGVYHTGLYGKRAFIILRDAMVYEVDNPSDLYPWWAIDSVYEDAHFYFQYPDHDAYDEAYWTSVKKDLLYNIKSPYGYLGYDNSDNDIPYHYMVRSHTTFADDGEIIFPFFSNWKEEKEICKTDECNSFFINLAERLNLLWGRLLKGTEVLPSGNAKYDFDSYSDKLCLRPEETRKLVCALENYFCCYTDFEIFRGDYAYKKEMAEVFEKYALGHPFNPIQTAVWDTLRNESHALLRTRSNNVNARTQERVREMYSKLAALYKQSLDMIE